MCLASPLSHFVPPASVPHGCTPRPKPLDFVGNDGAHFVDPAALRDPMTTQPGKPVDSDALHRDRARIDGRCGFGPVPRAALT